ncbi:MAG: hypothetical protein ACRD4X_09600 [Candidatus Acidiferrales bacterium]
MATLSPPPPIIQEPPKRPKTILWKWTLVATGIFMAFLLWECGTGLYQGHTLANSAVEHFHQELNNGQFEQICQEADPEFRGAQPHNQLVKFLGAVHAKLGNALSDHMTGIRVNATTSGTFIITSYDTKYGKGAARETFTWVKKSGALKLAAYNINSEALVLN